MIDESPQIVTWTPVNIHDTVFEKMPGVSSSQRSFNSIVIGNSVRLARHLTSAFTCGYRWPNPILSDAAGRMQLTRLIVDTQQ